MIAFAGRHVGSALDNHSSSFAFSLRATFDDGKETQQKSLKTPALLLYNNKFIFTKRSI